MQALDIVFSYTTPNALVVNASREGHMDPNAWQVTVPAVPEDIVGVLLGENTVGGFPGQDLCLTGGATGLVVYTPQMPRRHIHTLPSTWLLHDPK